MQDVKIQGLDIYNFNKTEFMMGVILTGIDRIDRTLSISY